MALISCPECGKEISNKAVACIHCGCPINVITESKCIIKATADSSVIEYGTGSCEIGVYDSEGNEITSLRTGSTVSFSVEKEMDVCVRYKKMWISSTLGMDVLPQVRKKLESNMVKVIPNKKTYLQISYISQFVFLQPKLHLSEVGMIDSE